MRQLIILFTLLISLSAYAQDSGTIKVKPADTTSIDNSITIKWHSLTGGKIPRNVARRKAPLITESGIVVQFKLVTTFKGDVRVQSNKGNKMTEQMIGAIWQLRSGAKFSIENIWVRGADKIPRRVADMKFEIE